MSTKTKTTSKIIRYHKRLKLADGSFTTIHVVRYRRQDLRPRIQWFQKPVRLQEWCEQNGYSEAVNGGFFLRSSGLPLGDSWQNGRRLPHVPFGKGWHNRRGSISIAPDGQITLAPRHVLSNPSGDLLEAGPTLVHRGVSLYLDSQDPEGFSDTAYQHDEDINYKRHPRAAIGSNEQYIWTVTADGRTNTDAGLYLEELAEVMVQLGVAEAINLDGGSSSSQIYGGQLQNTPRTTTPNLHGADHPMECVDTYRGEAVYTYPRGFLVYNAIVLA